MNPPQSSPFSTDRHRLLLRHVTFTTIHRRQALRNNSPTPPRRENILSSGQAFLIDFICAHVRLCPNEGRCRCGTTVNVYGGAWWEE